MAGVLTAAAPCVLPLLPVVVGGAVVTATDGATGRGDIARPVVIVASLGASVVVFTLLLKATSALLGVPQEVWSTLSGLVVLGLGVSLLAPGLWERGMAASGGQRQAAALLERSAARSGRSRDVLIGASLGPVFSSCSPTYALIVATVLPASFGEGLAYLVAYAVGLAVILLLLAVLGRAAAERLGWLANPHGVFRRVTGALFVFVGVAVMLGLDRDLQAFVLERGWYDPISDLEESLDG
ncbi:cytochrome C biogenesis protein [Conexibacter sp. W3-3-2]|uniref:Cytochrome C biogenesis protein n=2 Tax=Thermoleophilia TaxID=1497346 RepID=A0A2T4UN55_9ACTN|nr:cytochrome C biogenesis protein [Conexibacter sp. W3-3-2]PTL60672.1 cytochrome C biogenesis protein [Paraconexibacter algicola]